jgi:hypothetical protein
VTCPARVTVAITPARRGGGRARFGRACSICPLRDACTGSVAGRVVAINPHVAPSPPPVLASASRPGGPTTGRPAEGRAQARPPVAPRPRWPARPRAGPGAGRPGLQAAGRGGQPGPIRRTRPALQRQRLAGAARLRAAAPYGDIPTPLPQRAEHLQLVREQRPFSLSPCPGRDGVVAFQLLVSLFTPSGSRASPGSAADSHAGAGGRRPSGPRPPGVL